MSRAAARATLAMTSARTRAVLPVVGRETLVEVWAAQEISVVILVKTTSLAVATSAAETPVSVRQREAAHSEAAMPLKP